MTRGIAKRYFRGLTGKEKGKIGVVSPDNNRYGSRTFREVKELASNKFEWRWVVASNQS